MNDVGTLYLLCGKMAAGKSTLARELAKDRGAMLLSEDRMLASLYPGEVHGVETYVKYSRRLRATLRPHIVEVLTRGNSVVLDFAANTVGQREWMRGIITQSGAPHELHYLDVPDAVCVSRLEQRASQQPERRATDTIEMFRSITAHFQAPTPEEGFHVILHAPA